MFETQRSWHSLYEPWNGSYSVQSWCRSIHVWQAWPGHLEDEDEERPDEDDGEGQGCEDHEGHEQGCPRAQREEAPGRLTRHGQREQGQKQLRPRP